MSEEDRTEDQICFLRTLRAFREYSFNALHCVQARKQDFQNLPERHKHLLGFNADERLFAPVEDAIQVNQKFLNSVVESATSLFNSYWPRGPRAPLPNQPPSAIEVDKVFSTLKQLVRDWSDEGKQEREAVFAPIRDFLVATFPNPELRADVKVLLPGSGLSRTTLEVALLGFFAQGNEFSYHMLITGQFLLNHVTESKAFTIYPYADSSLNLFNRSDQCRPVEIPSVSCVDLVEQAEAQGIPFGPLSMVAGDFIEVYSKPEHLRNWDVIATIFFIDTAHNIVEYLETIYNALAPGGVWINVGPLMWHFANDLNELSLDLSLDEVLLLASRIGFVVDTSSYKVIDTTYTNNVRCMKQMLYRCAYFVARKPVHLPPAASSAGQSTSQPRSS